MDAMRSCTSRGDVHLYAWSTCNGYRIAYGSANVRGSYQEDPGLGRCDARAYHHRVCWGGSYDGPDFCQSVMNISGRNMCSGLIFDAFGSVESWGCWSWPSDVTAGFKTPLTKQSATYSRWRFVNNHRPRFSVSTITPNTKLIKGPSDEAPHTTCLRTLQYAKSHSNNVNLHTHQQVPSEIHGYA